MIDSSHATEVALRAAREASEIVMGVYAGPFAVEYKAANDPVTIADREANALLCDRLKSAFPAVPVVAEESDPATYRGFERAPAAWFVDPLDGTREFVAKNGEFVVMIGLARAGRASVGIVVAPAWNRAFVGVVGEGAWEVARDGTRSAISVSPHATLAGASILVSRSHKPPRIAELVSRVGARRTTLLGSSGLKAALVATGDHDAYVQPGLAGMRWDACASEALVVAAGGRCTDSSGTPIDYATSELINSHGLIATNGLLHDQVLDSLRA